MTLHIAKVIEIGAASEKSIEDAVRSGLAKVAATVGEIRGALVSDIKVCTSPSGEVTEWRVTMRVTFIVRSD
jgi:flavin-binding protein dodecin